LLKKEHIMKELKTINLFQLSRIIFEVGIG